MNSEHINAQHQTKRGKETFLSFYLPVACNKALCKLNPHSVQLVARNHQLRTEVESPRSVQLVARNRQSRTEVESPRSVQLVARNRQSYTEVKFPRSTKKHAQKPPHFIPYRG